MTLVWRMAGTRRLVFEPRASEVLDAALELLARLVRARDGGGAPSAELEEIHQAVRLAARPPLPAAGDGGESATAAGSFTFTVPASWPMLTTGEVAELHGVSPQAVRAALRRGKLTGERRRGGWLVREDTARMWMPRRPDGGSSDTGQDDPGDGAAAAVVRGGNRAGPGDQRPDAAGPGAGQ